MKSFTTDEKVYFITTFSRSRIKHHCNELYLFTTAQLSWITIGRGRDNYISYKGVDGSSVTFGVIANMLCLNYTKW